MTLCVGLARKCGGKDVRGRTFQRKNRDAGQLIINGKAVSEPELHSTTPRYEGFVEYPVRLGEGEFFILADHRNGGEDSRYYGVVRTGDLLGTVITAIRRNHL